jgi:hypothetical protein
MMSKFYCFCLADDTSNVILNMDHAIAIFPGEREGEVCIYFNDASYDIIANFEKLTEELGAK